MASKQFDENKVCTLRGSSQMISEFFGYAVNTLLYLRNVYSSETFKATKQYDLTMQMTTDPEVKKYIANWLQQVYKWFLSGKVNQLVVVLETVGTKKPVERWVFDVETDQQSLFTGEISEEKESRSEKEIQTQIRSLVKQITQAVTFLPVPSEPCTFDLLAYTDQGVEIPTSDWEETGAQLLSNPCHLELRSFDTGIQRVS